MDAEIGVRNLADSFRYNALPDIVEALGLASGKIGQIAESFEDLPEFERLQMLVGFQSLWTARLSVLCARMDREHH